MSKSQMVMTWQRNREELYRCLKEEFVPSPRDLETARACFDITEENQYRPKPYCFPHPDQGVHFIGCAAPRDIHHKSEELQRLIHEHQLLPSCSVYWNIPSTLHLTLFHSARPGKSTRDTRVREIMTLDKLFVDRQRLRLRWNGIVITASGAIVALFDDSECAIDELREELRRVFPQAPKDQTSTIIHSTLGRILSWNVSSPSTGDMKQELAQAQDHFQSSLWNEKSSREIEIQDLWHIHETHQLSAVGSKTVWTLAARDST